MPLVEARDVSRVFPMPAGPVADDGEAELVGMVVETKMVPRIALFGLHAQIG